MIVAIGHTAVIVPEGGKLAAYVYEPGEQFPETVLCQVSIETNGRLNRGELKKRLIAAARSQGLELSRIYNLQRL